MAQSVPDDGELEIRQQAIDDHTVLLESRSIALMDLDVQLPDMHLDTHLLLGVWKQQSIRAQT
jgi:hypothetical protein